MNSMTQPEAPLTLNHLSMDRCRAMFVVICALACSTCSEPRGPVSVKSDDPTLKIPAIKADVQRNDEADVPLLVQNLNDEDPAVRFYAVEGLRRLTGDDFGYRYYDDADRRQPAVTRWENWLKHRDGK